jgi:hypothetical protein
MTTSRHVSGAVPLQTDAYSDQLIDVASLNEHISAKLESRIDDVMRTALDGVATPTAAFTILGAAGGGKTHLFARLRNHCGPHATFVLLRPFFGVNLMPRDVLSACVDQLCAAPGSDTSTEPSSQLALIAAHWLSAAGVHGFPSMVLDEFAEMNDTLRQVRVGLGVNAVLAKLPRVAAVAHIVRAVLQVASNRQPDHHAMAWLAGRDVGVAEYPPMGEADVMHALRIVAFLAAPVAPLVVVFDQLENLAGADSSRVIAYGSVISELVDSVADLTLVQLALTSEWQQFIEPALSLPHKTRVAQSIDQLQAPSRAQRLELLTAWHEHTFAGDVSKQFPAPMADDSLQELLDAPGMTPRLLLLGFQQALRGGQTVLFSSGIDTDLTKTSASDKAPPNADAGSLDTVWQQEQHRATTRHRKSQRAQQPFDNGELTEGLATTLRYLPNADVAIAHEGAVLRIILKTPGQELSFLAMNGGHHSSVVATLNRAMELVAKQKVVLVRELRWPIPETWSAVASRRQQFERMPNARWLWLTDEDVILSLALAQVHSLVRSQRLAMTEAELLLRCSVDLAPIQWQLLAAASRFVSDVPHAPAVNSRGRSKKADSVRMKKSSVAVPNGDAVTTVVVPGAAKASDTATVAPPSASPATAAPATPPTVRQWIILGRDLAKDIAKDTLSDVRHRALRLLGRGRSK